MSDTDDELYPVREQIIFDAGYNAAMEKVCEGWEVVEECKLRCIEYPEACDNCVSGTITRHATWEEIEEVLMWCLTIGGMKQVNLNEHGQLDFTLKLGGRLRVKK